MFVILSFVKIFHWLVQDRVDFIETTPNVTRLQHVRIVTFTLVLLVSVLAAYAVVGVGAACAVSPACSTCASPYSPCAPGEAWAGYC